MKWFVMGVAAALSTLTACNTEEGEQPVLATMHTVEVWFARNEQPEAVHRRVAGSPLDGALRALVIGPTPEERADGLTSWFSPETRNVIRRIQAEDGEVIVDFRELPAVIPGASSSAGSQHLLAALDSTVFQFDWVESVEYRLDGSCQAFWEWLQRECEVVTR